MVARRSNKRLAVVLVRGSCGGPRSRGRLETRRSCGGHEIKQEVTSCFDTRELVTDKRSVTVLTRGSCCGKGSYKRSVVVFVGDTREL